MLLTTEPSDLVLDPTCGSGTTAVVAEQWGRRWITIDTSRVALALARTRLMAARHPAYLLRDSAEGASKEAEITGRPPEEGPFRGDIRQGFVLERVPHVTLKSIANNAEIDVIHAKWQPQLDAARAAVNEALRGHATPFRVAAGARAGRLIDFRSDPAATETLPSGEAAPLAGLLEWELPREAPADWPQPARSALAAFWQARRARQAEMDASIARNAEIEYLHDRPYTKRNAVRVTGPFTVESLSPHRVLPADEEEEAVVEALAAEAGEAPPPRRRLRPKAEPTGSAARGADRSAAARGPGRGTPAWRLSGVPAGIR